MLERFRATPEKLVPLVLAGLCGLRADEIQGKRTDRSRRQRWEDIHLDREFLSVTAAKENTPANRVVPLQPAALAWLRLHAKPSGPVCGPAGMIWLRRLVTRAGFKMPPNALRHSYISYRIAACGNKAEVANEAGNSVSQIDQHYRVPLPKEEGEKWFKIFPKIEA